MRKHSGEHSEVTYWRPQWGEVRRLSKTHDKGHVTRGIWRNPNSSQGTLSMTDDHDLKAVSQEWFEWRHSIKNGKGILQIIPIKSPYHKESPHQSPSLKRKPPSIPVTSIRIPINPRHKKGNCQGFPLQYKSWWGFDGDWRGLMGIGTYLGRGHTRTSFYRLAMLAPTLDQSRTGNRGRRRP